MFSLIITIVSIALVAALALATLYYGGSAFNKGSADAEASKIMLQGQQLLGAADLYYAEKNAWPTLQQLLDEGYLKSAPQAAGQLSMAQAAGRAWSTPAGSQALFLLTGDDLSLDTCAAVNLKGTLRKRGVLKDAYPSLNAQCFGEGTTLKVVFKKFSGDDSLDNAGLDLATEVVKGAVPGEDELAAWTRVPDVQTAAPYEPPVETGPLWLNDTFTGATGTVNAHEAESGAQWSGDRVELRDGSFNLVSQVQSGYALLYAPMPADNLWVEYVVSMPAPGPAAASGSGSSSSASVVFGQTGASVVFGQDNTGKFQATLYPEGPHLETQQAFSATPSAQGVEFRVNVYGRPWMRDADAACADHVGRLGLINGQPYTYEIYEAEPLDPWAWLPGPTNNTGTSSGWHCRVWVPQHTYFTYEALYIRQAATTYSCPANSTMSGTSCTCNAGSVAKVVNGAWQCPLIPEVRQVLTGITAGQDVTIRMEIAGTTCTVKVNGVTQATNNMCTGTANASQMKLELADTIAAAEWAASGYTTGWYQPIFVRSIRGGTL